MSASATRHINSQFALFYPQFFTQRLNKSSRLVEIAVLIEVVVIGVLNQVWYQGSLIVV